MKKIFIILLIGIIPFLSFAQKKSKKDKSIFPVKNSSVSYEFIVIKGFTSTDSDVVESTNASRSKITFDLVGSKTAENIAEMNFKTLAHAVNSAAKEGWEFINSDVVLLNEKLYHFYYMKKKINL